MTLIQHSYTVMSCTKFISGQGSPKALFEGHSIMLMELVKGKPLCHRTEGNSHKSIDRNRDILTCTCLKVNEY